MGRIILRLAQVLLALSCAAHLAQGQVITTVAGGGQGDGGPALLARVAPRAITVDAAGNLYFVDASERVRRVDARSGLALHFAGGGSALGDGGPASIAGMRAVGVALDSRGDLHISDALHSRVRKVDAATGVITTVASLPDPSSIAIDASGNVYVSSGTSLRKVEASTGAVTTVTTIPGPIGFGSLAVDSRGNLFIGSFDHILKLDASTGAISTVTDRIFPAGLAIDRDDNIYITSWWDHRVYRMAASSGSISTVAGTGADRRNCSFFCTDGYFAGDGGPAEDAGLNGPRAVAVDAAGNLFIADTGNLRIRRVDADTRIITTVAGRGNTISGDGGLATNAWMRSPEALAVDSNGDFYVGGDYFVRKVTAATGIIDTIAGTGNPNESGDGGLAIDAGVLPSGLALDAAGNVFVSGNLRVRKIARDTGIITTVASDLGGVWGIALDAAGNIYVADSFNHRIRKVAVATGATTSIAGTGAAGDSGDGGPATSAALNLPTALASDGRNLYVMDWRNRRVRKIDLATGVITAAASVAGDIRGGIAVDAAGSLYVAGVDAVFKVPAGGGAPSSIASGIATTTGIGLDAHGNLHFAEMGGRVRKVSPTADNYGGLWWNYPPGSESGWGVNLAHQGETLFATWFTYDAEGNGLWLVMPNGVRSGSAFGGALYRTTGPAYSASPWNPAQVSATLVGSAYFTFANVNNGQFGYTVNGITHAKQITREVFASPVPTCVSGGTPAGAPNYRDLWWRSGGTESGWGVNLTHQGDTLFATWFTYDAAGKGQWLVMSNGSRTGPGRFAGALYRTRGPAFDALPWDRARVTAAQVGTATFAFDDADAGTFAYVVDGVSQSKPITRQVFASPPTVCR